MASRNPPRRRRTRQTTPTTTRARPQQPRRPRRPDQLLVLGVTLALVATLGTQALADTDGGVSFFESVGEDVPGSHAETEQTETQPLQTEQPQTEQPSANVALNTDSSSS